MQSRAQPKFACGVFGSKQQIYNEPAGFAKPPVLTHGKSVVDLVRERGGVFDPNKHVGIRLARQIQL